MANKKVEQLAFVDVLAVEIIKKNINNAQAKEDILLQRKIYNVGVIFHLISAVIILLVLAVLFYIFFNGVLNIPSDRVEAAKIVYLCLMVSTFFNIITVPYDASINAHEDLLTYSIIGIIDIFLKLGVAIAIKYSSGDKLVLYAFLMMIVPVATYGMMKIWSRLHYEECELSVRKYYDKKVASDMLSFSGWSLLGTTTNLVGNYGNSIVLNHFFGTVLNAVMGIANQFQGMLLVLSSGMLRSLNPIIYKSGVTNPKSLMIYSYMGCKYAYLLLAIFAIPVIIYTPYILQIWIGTVPEWAILFVRLQLIRCLIEQLTATLNRSLESVGKIKYFNIWISVLNIIPIPVLYCAYYMGMPPSGHYLVAIFFMVLCVSVVKIKYCVLYCGLEISKYLEYVIMPCLLCTIPSVVLGYTMSKMLVADSIISLIFTALVIILSIIIIAYFKLTVEERKVIALIKTRLSNKIFKR